MFRLSAVFRWRVHSPTPDCSDAVRADRATPANSRSVLVVSHHPDGFLRIQRPQACCILCPTMRSATFPAFRVLSHRASPVRRTELTWLFRNYAHLSRLRNTPRRIPLTRSRYASLRPVAFLMFHTVHNLVRTTVTEVTALRSWLGSLVPPAEADGSTQARKPFAEATSAVNPVHTASTKLRSLPPNRSRATKTPTLPSATVSSDT